MRNKPRVCLLPEYEDQRSQRAVLDEYWPALFEAMLGCWLTDEALWPKNRTRTMFDEWFEIQMCSLVQDLCLDEPLACSKETKVRTAAQNCARLSSRIGRG